jgi:transposase-like protein
MKPHKYVIRLGSKEKQLLREVVGRGKSEARLVERARILLWAHVGVTIDETARHLDCHREKVIFWRKRYLERRREGIPTCLQDLPRSGRPPVFSP